MLNETIILKFRSHPISEIVEKYLECNGMPEEGERFRYYNEMAKNFRYIIDGDAEVLVDCLPLFDATRECRLKQCRDICRLRKGEKIPYTFYVFLHDNGFWDEPETNMEEEEEWQLTNTDNMPTLPPVFREFCSVAPKDFKYPTIVALLPVMGTMTSYLRAPYFDQPEQSTTFFNIIYGEASSGKSFVQRSKDVLLSKINQRDELADIREQLYIQKKAGKGANDRGPADPHTKQIVISPINSQPQFLQKMRDNKGHHMFSFAEEVDTFAKGTEGGGIDKSDMFRAAWDNSNYGQNYKSADTFRGKVRLYYNFLLTGTPRQVLRYFHNVENGMVTRISVCPIENQRFAKMPIWKKMPEKSKKVIDAFIERCDRNTYMEPLNYNVEDAYNLDEKEFESQVPWKYEYKPLQHIDLSWTYSWIDGWQEKQRLKASMGDDHARDVFRRRTTVKGFRLALLCHACWDRVGKREQEIIKNFVLWFMDMDLENSLALFGEKYNEEMRTSGCPTPSNHTNLYVSLPEKFSTTQMDAKIKELNIGSTGKMIRSRWKKERFIKKLSQSMFQKIW